MDYYKNFLQKNCFLQFYNEYKKNMLTQGYLFYSHDSKTNREFLKCVCMAVMCSHNLCGDCPDCAKIKIDAHPDIAIFPRGKSFAVSDAEGIIEEAIKKPMSADNKIIIINDIDNSSVDAQNKILKIVENPPQNVIFFATCTNLEAVLPTIKSRMQKRQVDNFTESEIKQIFDAQKFEPSFDVAVLQGNGYLGKTLEILNSKTFLDTYNFASSLVFELKSSANVISYTSKIANDKQIANDILEIMSGLYRDEMMFKLNKPNLIKNKNKISDIQKLADEISVNAIVKIQNLIINAKKRLQANTNVLLTLETMLVKILEVKYLCK